MDVNFWKDKRVFLTGHTGFKGAWLTRLLHHMGAKVIGYALAPEEESMFHMLQLESLVAVSYYHDILDADTLSAAIKNERPDIVIHFAAQSLVRESYAHPIETLKVNALGTALLLEACRNAESLKSILVITTDKCYENFETTRGYVESDPLGGHDLYSASKACAEIVTSSYARSFLTERGICVMSARAGNVIGGGDFSKDRLVPDLFRSMQGNASVQIRHPESIRPWQHVLEPLAGYLSLVELSWSSPDLAKGAWNFGPEAQSTCSVGELIESFLVSWKSLDVQMDKGQKPHEAKLLFLNIDKAKNTLGWRPKLSFDEMISWTSDWYLGFMTSIDAANKITLKQIEKFVQR